MAYRGWSLAVTSPLIVLARSFFLPSLSPTVYFYKTGRNIIIVVNSQPVSNLVEPAG